MNGKILKWGMVLAVIIFLFFWIIVFIENRPMTVENTKTVVSDIQPEDATSTTLSYLKDFIEKDSAFFVPESMATGTNLSRDSKISFETKNASSCDATIFAKDADITSKNKSQEIIIGTTTYSTLTFSGAGAGNFYETTIYSTKASSSCSALKLFIHSTNIGNYDPGTIKEFDKTKLLEIFAKVLQNFPVK
ncbi:MAG: hypothetical protein WC629_02100 [Candidatus Paceibacterota bacterium]|jgi:hypothetical protein